MNRKHKIIVSVVGIFIILLALLGITYGYFLTRIVGNTNDTSVYITTANLRLVYGDGNGIVYAYNIQPNNEFVTFVDENGNMLGQTKTFTVKNEGNQRVDYEVYLEDVINNFVHYDDLVLKISCVSNIEGNTCNGYDNIYPVENSKLIMNSISPVDESKNTPAEIHTYTLTLKFLDDGDQSDDMGKTLQGKVQIYDPKDVIAISGEVTNYTDGDYAEIHSDVKKSQIRKVVENGETKYTYKFYGVKQTETHKIYLKNSNLSDEINETRFQQIKISKDETNDIVSNNEIVVNENTETVDVNITVNNSDNSIGLNINEIVDNTNTDLLRDKIILNNVVWKDNNLDLLSSNGSGLYITTDTSVTEDIDGDGVGESVYYFRGDIKNNYVKFGKYETPMVLGFQYRTAERYFRYFTSMSECQSDSTYNLNCTVVADIGDDMLWQILRVNEDGSIRLIYHTPILEDFDVPNGIGSVYYNELNGDNAYNGYMYGMTGIEEEISSPMCLTYDSINNKAIDSTTTYSTKELCENSNGKWVTTAYQATHASVVDSTIKKYIDGWYETYLKDNLDGYLVDAGFCNDRGVASNPGVWTSADTAKGYGTNTTYYASRLRLNYTTELTEKVRFKCKNKNDLFSTNLSNGNGSLTYPIGIITTDEVVYSGINRNEREDNNNFLIIDEDYWTMTPYLFYEDNFIFATVKDGAYLKTIVGNGTERTARPVINIDKNSIITNLNQNGTINNPYEIKLEEQ